MAALTKLLVFILVFAIQVVLREAFSVWAETRKQGGRYAPGKGRLILLAISISYIFTIIFTGFSF